MLRGARLSHEQQAADPRSRYRTLFDMLEGTAERSPRRGIYIVDERGHQEFRTYPQILEAALRFGAALERRGLGKYDRVLFVLPTSFEFVTAFFGATSIGAIPVPIAPPRSDVIADASDRAEAVLRMSERLQTPAALFRRIPLTPPPIHYNSVTPRSARKNHPPEVGERAMLNTVASAPDVPTPSWPSPQSVRRARP